MISKSFSIKYIKALLKKKIVFFDFLINGNYLSVSGDGEITVWNYDQIFHVFSSNLPTE